MAIEENQGDVMNSIRNWIVEIKESVSKWISQGEIRAKSAGREIELQIGHLGTCLEVVWEEIQEEGEEYEGQTREMSKYMAGMEFWSYVRIHLDKMEQRAPNSPMTVFCEEEGGKIESKEGQNLNEEEDEALAYNENGMETACQIRKQNPGVSREWEKVEVVGNLPENPIMTDYELLREELVGVFQKMVMEAAHMEKVKNAVWIVGLKEQRGFEPVFLLEMVRDYTGFKFGPDPDLLGPPPWNSHSPKSVGPIFHQTKSKIGNFGSWLEVQGPFQWSNCLIERPELRPQFQLHGVHPIFIINRANTLQNLLRLCNQRRTLEPPIQPPEKPLPEKLPPDFPTYFFGLEFCSTVVDVLLTSRPPLRISGKRDAAGDDPGDHQSFLFLTFTLDFKHNLEDKAALKGSVRAWVLTMEGRRVEAWTFLQPPPAGPPSVPTKVLVYALVQLSVSVDAARDDTGDEAFSTLNRVNGVHSYGAFGCLVPTFSDITLGYSLRLLQPCFQMQP